MPANVKLTTQHLNHLLLMFALWHGSWFFDFPSFPLHNRLHNGYKQFVRPAMHSSAFIVFSVSAKFRSSWLESKSVSFLGGFCWVIAREEITWNHLNGNHSQQVDRIGSDRIQVLWMKPKRTAQGRCAGFYVWYLFPAVFFPRFGTFWWYELGFDMDLAVRRMANVVRRFAFN